MCKECGCGIVEGFRVDGEPVVADPGPGTPGVAPGAAHTHSHEAGEDHGHSHPHPHGPHVHGADHAHDHRTVPVHEAILDKNDRLAERNRGYFAGKGLLVLNLLSSPGAGKTAFIERTVADLGARLRVGVIVGDLETDNDARRLRGRGVPAVQITTGNVCHLDAEMVAHALERLELDALQVLIIENVGNLVCPASYDLGEDFRVVIMSVTEGEDKPLKYPVMFRTAQVVVVNKTDILEAVGFDRETALQNIRRVAPQATIFELSARTGEGMAQWYQYLEERLRRPRHGVIRNPAGTAAS